MGFAGNTEPQYIVPTGLKFIEVWSLLMFVDLPRSYKWNEMKLKRTYTQIIILLRLQWFLSKMTLKKKSYVYFRTFPYIFIHFPCENWILITTSFSKIYIF